MKPAEHEPSTEDQPANKPATEGADPGRQGKGAGDQFEVKIGDVGEGAQVAVGKSITQVGSLVLNVFQTNSKLIVLLFVPVLVSLAVILYVLLGSQDQRPARMTGTFNIAVAAFDVLADGQSRGSEEGEILAGWLVDQLRSEEPSYPPGTRVEIWGPDLTGRVAGQDEDERAAEAQRLAEEIGANIVIYGHIVEEGDSVEVDPQFYVATRGFEAAQEITGPHQMGSSIMVAGDIFADPVSGAQVNRELNGRAIALSHFTLGLIHFALQDYQSAFEAFQEANQTEGWEESQGKEVIYLFLGNAALNIGELDRAHSWFEAALEANPEYARGHIGQGLTYFQEALEPLPDEPAETGLLYEAIEAFQAGIDARYHPPEADVSAKGHFGLGRTYVVLSVQGDVELWEEARTELRLVTDAYESGQVRFEELAAQAYGQLGLLNYILKEDDQAITAYERALEIGDIDSFKAEWATRLSQIYAERGEGDTAARYEALAAEYGE